MELTSANVSLSPQASTGAAVHGVHDLVVDFESLYPPAQLRSRPPFIAVDTPADAHSQFPHETWWGYAVQGSNLLELVALGAIPQRPEDLHDVAVAVAGYFKHIVEDANAKVANTTSRDVAIPQKSTTSKNVDEATKLVLFCVRKRLGYCASYPVLFNAEQMHAFDELITASRTSTITTEHVHNAVYSLFNSEAIDSSECAFNHPVERFLACLARHPSGTGWTCLPDLSSGLARLEWCARTSVLYDASLHAHEHPKGCNDSLNVRIHLLRNTDRFPFNLICDMKAAITRNIEGATRGPEVIVARDRVAVSMSYVQGGILRWTRPRV